MKTLYMWSSLTLELELTGRRGKLRSTTLLKTPKVVPKYIQVRNAPNRHEKKEAKAPAPQKKVEKKPDKKAEKKEEKKEEKPRKRK